VNLSHRKKPAVVKRRHGSEAPDLRCLRQVRYGADSDRIAALRSLEMRCLGGLKSTFRGQGRS
jgi:hypothetical protein